MKKRLLLYSLLLYYTGYSQTWTKLSSGTTTNLIGVSAPSASVCYVCGGAGLILKTTDGGLTWVQKPTGIGENLYVLSFVDVNTGYAFGDNGSAIKTTDGGTTWSSMFVSNQHIRNTWFEDKNTGYVLASTTTSGEVFKTIDGGATWNKIGIPSAHALYSIQFNSSSVGYAGDYGGSVHKTTDGGANWTSKKISSSPLNGSMIFLDPNKAFVIGLDGVIYRTTDAGTNWSLIASGTVDALSGIDFYDATHGFITGGDINANTYRMLSTSDGGASWTNVTLEPGTNRLYGISFFGNTGYAVGLGGYIYKYFVPVNVVLDARFTSSEPGCHGQLENFYSVASGTPGLTHTWSFGNGANPSVSIAQDPAGIVYSSSGAKVVTHIVSNGISADTVTRIITINPSPVASFNVKPAACVNELLNISNTSVSSPGVTYSWDFGTGAIPQTSTSINPQGIYYLSGGTKTIALTVTNQFGCITSITQNVVVNPLPTAFAGLDEGVCPNTNVQLGTTPTSGYTYSWSPSATLNSAIIANPIANPVNPLTIYILTVTQASTGCQNKDSVNISIKPAPIASFTNNSPVCEHAALDFVNTGSSGAGTTYVWDFGKGANPAIATSQHPKGVVYYSSGAKTITLSVTNHYGCATSITQSLLVNGLPPVFAGLDTTICPRTSIILGQLPDPGIAYTWFPSATLSNKNSSNPIASPIAPVTTYVLTATNLSTGCKNQDTIIVTMLDYLKANAGIDGEICRYNNFQLGTGLVKGQSYSWNPIKGLNDPTLPNPVAHPDSTITYTLTVTANGCTAVTDNVTLIVHQLPLVDAGVNDTIGLGAKIQLNAKGGVQYNWLPETGLSNSGIYNPLASPKQTTSYTVTVTDIYGCMDSDSVLLTVLTAHFWVPTAFTPDGNGISDIFYVRGEDIRNFECVVFNRFGEQIFISRNMENGWDGKRQNGGEDLPIGAYLYHIKGTLGNGEVVNATGMINLIR